MHTGRCIWSLVALGWLVFFARVPTALADDPGWVLQHDGPLSPGAQQDGTCPGPAPSGQGGGGDGCGFLGLDCIGDALARAWNDTGGVVVHALASPANWTVPPPGTRVTYHGGAVISHARVVPVFWGPQVAPSTVQGVPRFLCSIADSPYLAGLSEYSTPGQTIGRGSCESSYTIYPAGGQATTDVSAIQAEIDREITAGRLPPPDPNTVYMIYLPPGALPAPAGSTDQCGYHDSFPRGGQSVRYFVLGDPQTTGCGDRAHPFQAVTSMSSHDLAEIITDPDPGSGWLEDKLGSLGEIGDLCNGDDVVVGGYSVQQLWDQARHSCVAAGSSTP